MIDLAPDDLPVSDEWTALAANELQKIRGARSSNQEYGFPTHWTRLKPTLSELRGEKCWYCEAPTASSFGDIDHFRPKKAVLECNGHSGYWWLAYDVSNYRFSCEKCNRSHKRNQFPLADEGTRAHDEGHDHEKETTRLIDPLHGGAKHLNFMLDGTCYVKPQTGHGPCAKISVSVYQLDFHSKKEGRKRAMVEMTRAIQEFRKIVPMGDDLWLQQKIEEIRSMVAPSADFSLAARRRLAQLIQDDPSLAALAEIIGLEPGRNDSL